jgi:hypothetical protein
MANVTESNRAALDQSSEPLHFRLLVSCFMSVHIDMTGV